MSNPPWTKLQRPLHHRLSTTHRSSSACRCQCRMHSIDCLCCVIVCLGRCANDKARLRKLRTPPAARSPARRGRRHSGYYPRRYVIGANNGSTVPVGRLPVRHAGCESRGYTQDVEGHGSYICERRIHHCRCWRVRCKLRSSWYLGPCTKAFCESAAARIRFWLSLGFGLGI